MNVFKRMGDIISSNVNSMLDKMEDPKKMINLMITEMEDTEREIRMSIAEKTAEGESIRRNLESVNAATARWAERAALAVDNGNDDLAREAIIEKKKSSEGNWNKPSRSGFILRIIIFLLFFYSLIYLIK